MADLKPFIPPKEIIWMKCRASEKCPSNQAYISLIKPLGSLTGGTMYRYRCVVCDKIWHITR